MGTVKEWLEGVAKSNQSSEKDSRMMQNLMHKAGFDKAVVVYGIVYPEGRGRPVSIHAMAKEFLSTIPAKKKGEWAKERVCQGDVFSPDYIQKNEVYTGKRTFRDVNERNEKARELRKEGWKVKSFSYSDFCGFDAVRERSEKKGEWAKRRDDEEGYDWKGDNGKVYKVPKGLSVSTVYADGSPASYKIDDSSRLKILDKLLPTREEAGEWAKRTKHVAFPAGKSSKAKRKSKRTTSKASRVR